MANGGQLLRPVSIGVRTAPSCGRSAKSVCGRGLWNSLIDSGVFPSPASKPPGLLALCSQSSGPDRLPAPRPSAPSSLQGSREIASHSAGYRIGGPPVVAKRVRLSPVLGGWMSTYKQPPRWALTRPLTGDPKRGLRTEWGWGTNPPRPRSIAAGPAGVGGPPSTRPRGAPREQGKAPATRLRIHRVPRPGSSVGWGPAWGGNRP